MDNLDKELCARTPMSINENGFNEKAIIPHGCTPSHIKSAMLEFLDFLGFINTQLGTRDLPRLESFLMPANFSSMVGEFMVSSIPKYCTTIVKNLYHNGHPDMIPAGTFPNNSIQHADKGIEIKGSRHLSGWQGHNRENTWLMVFCFNSNTSRDRSLGIQPKQFEFIKVIGAQLTKEDWNYSGRSATSRRTITASVNQSGFAKMEANWIYKK